MRFKSVLLLFLLAALTAFAGPISPVTGSVDATFLNQSEGSIRDGGLTFRFGSDTWITNYSYLRATEGNFSEDVGDKFALTTLSFENGENFASASMSVELRLAVTFTAPSGVLTPYELYLPIFNTSGDDRVTLSNSFGPLQSVTADDGWKYTLVIDGWARPSNWNEPRPELVVGEGDTRSAVLVSHVVATQTTPEPGTVSMALFGLGILVAARKFRRAR